MTSVDTTIIGNNIAPWKDDNIDIDFFISFGGGLINIYSSNYLDSELSQTKKGLFSVFIASLGFLVSWGNFKVSF